MYIQYIPSNTVKPLKVDTLKYGHFSNMDTSLCPKNSRE